MTARFRQRGQVLILLGTWLLLGGSAGSALVVYVRPASEMKKAVKQVVPGGERREELLADIDRWESVQKQHDKAVAKGRDELLEILQRQDATRTDVQPQLAILDQRFGAMDQDFLDLRFRIRQRVSASEWARIVRSSADSS